MIEKIKNKIYKLLKKSEKFFQTDMIYLVKNGFWLTLGQLTSSASSFLLAIAFANLLPKETYGTYKYVLSIIGMLSVFTLSGMGTSLTRSVARGFEGDLKNILKEKIKWGSIGSLVSLAIAIYYYSQQNLTLTICFIITAIFLPIMDSFGIYGALLNGRGNFKLATKFNIITQIISSTLMIITLILSKNIFLILFTYFISNTSLKFIFLKLIIKKEKSNSKTESDTISYGKHLSLMNVLGVIANQIDKILVWHFIGPAQLAIYSIAIAMPEQIKGVFKNLNVIIFPKMVLIQEESIKKRYKKLYLQIFILISIIIIIYIYLATPIFKIFFPKYLNSILYSQIAILALFNLITIPASNYLLAKQKTKEQYINNITSSTIQITLLIILVPSFGIWGCIAARILFRFISAIITHILFIRNIKKIS